MHPFGIMFHHFCDERHPQGQGAINADQLRKLIEWIGPGRFVGPEEWIERAHAGTLKDGQVCVSFDDNLRCQYDVALPVLEDFGIKAFWFVYTSVLEGELEKLEVYRYFRTTFYEDMQDFYADFEACVASSPYGERLESLLPQFDPNQYLAEASFYSPSDRKFRFLRDEVLGPQAYMEIMSTLLKQRGAEPEQWRPHLWMDHSCLKNLQALNHELGLHSHTHPTRLERLDYASQKEEFGRNYTALKGLLNGEVRTMSHPCNSYNATTLDVLQGLAIKLGFRANSALKNYGLLEMPRIDHANLVAKMEGR